MKIESGMLIVNVKSSTMWDIERAELARRRLGLYIYGSVYSRDNVSKMNPVMWDHGDVDAFHTNKRYVILKGGI